jgi:hypothetical protein
MTEAKLKSLADKLPGLRGLVVLCLSRFGIRLDVILRGSVGGGRPRTRMMEFSSFGVDGRISLWKILPVMRK